MNKLLFSLGYIIVILLFSCSNNNDRAKDKFINEDGLLVKRFFYASGKVKSEQSFIRDTVKQGYLKTFYENGALKLEMPYLSGKKHGLEKGYYMNGTLEHFGWYKDDKQDGLWFWFYENKKIKAKDFWKDDKPFGVQIKFYEDGITIKEYLFYNIIGEMVFKSVFDKNKHLLKEEGNPIPMIIAEKYNFQTNDSLKAKIYIVTPPNYEKILVLTKIDYKGAGWDTLYEIKENYYHYHKKILTNTDCQWLIKIIIKKAGDNKMYNTEKKITLKVKDL